MSQNEGKAQEKMVTGGGAGYGKNGGKRLETKAQEGDERRKIVGQGS